MYLTNALEPAGDEQLMLDVLPALAHEAEAVNEIKRKQRFTVVIGNPPYSGISSNMGPWIDGLLKGRLPDGTVTSRATTMSAASRLVNARCGSKTTT